MAVVQVAIDVPVDQLFDYHDNALQMEEGSFVLVPFRRIKKIGVIFRINPKTSLPIRDLKNIEEVLLLPPVSPETLKLIEFNSKYYCHPIGQVVATFLPGYVRKTKNKDKYQSVSYALTTQGRTNGIINLNSRATNLAKLLDYMKNNDAVTAMQIRSLSSNGIEKVDSWVEKGWASRQIVPAFPLTKLKNKSLSSSTISGGLSLTEDQLSAVNKINSNLDKFKVWVLHGITGSGKTEVYLEVIKEVSEKGGQTLVLVPEINLTPQLESRFQRRFPLLNISFLNSKISEQRRFEIWDDARAGNVDILLGTRLSISAGLPHLGLIVVDEEHDSSYKQQEGLRYSARDIAIFRAFRSNIPIVLGSATPSLETYKNGLDGKFEIIKINSRPKANLPLISVVDISKDQHGLSICQELVKKIKAKLKNKEQTLIYINRRGFSSALICNSCGWVSDCIRCTARMTFHKKINKLICHYCGYKSSKTECCPACDSSDLYGPGQGTQSIEEDIKLLFPEAKVLRVDSDTTKTKNAFSEMRSRIISGEIDIIIGTQMLSKGHDFPKLTLVGILEADSMLYSSDYSAPEKLFQHLIQVSGRAGRGTKDGEVVVQTCFPNHFLFQALRHHNYDLVASFLLKERQAVGFPPFAYQVVLRAEAQESEKLFELLREVANFTQKISEVVIVHDPSPAIISKIAGRFRGQLLLQAKTRSSLSFVVSRIFQKLQKKQITHVKWAIDRDPLGI